MKSENSKYGSNTQGRRVEITCKLRLKLYGPMCAISDLAMVFNLG